MISPAPLPSTTYETLYCYSSSLGQALTELAARDGLRIVYISQQHNDFMVHVTYYYETLEEEENRLYPPRMIESDFDPSRWDFKDSVFGKEPDGFVTPGQPDVPFEEYRPLIQTTELNTDRLELRGKDNGFDENVMDDDGGPVRDA